MVTMCASLCVPLTLPGTAVSGQAAGAAISNASFDLTDHQAPFAPCWLEVVKPAGRSFHDKVKTITGVAIVLAAGLFPFLPAPFPNKRGHHHIPGAPTPAPPPAAALPPPPPPHEICLIDPRD